MPVCAEYGICDVFFIEQTGVVVLEPSGSAVV